MVLPEVKVWSELDPVPGLMQRTGTNPAVKKKKRNAFHLHMVNGRAGLVNVDCGAAEWGVRTTL